MTRKQIENLEQSGAYIEQMFHTLASIESSTYRDFLEDIYGLGHISERLTQEIFQEYSDNNEIAQMFIDYSLYGFIAEIRMPERSDFRFKKDGSFKSCRINPGIMTCEYVFGFTIDELVEKATKIGNDFRKKQEDEARESLADA